MKAGLTGFIEELDVRCESKRGIKQHFILGLCVCFGQSPKMNGGVTGMNEQPGRWEDECEDFRLCRVEPKLPVSTAVQILSWQLAFPA